MQPSFDFPGRRAGVLFFLGTHRPSWLARLSVPLFVSRCTLGAISKPPRARVPWAMDSGGFTELSKHGRWTLDAPAYADIVRRAVDRIGNLLWAAPQDWMCEPVMLAKTGLTVAEHQRRTVDNFLELRSIAPNLPIIPVLQGWTLGDYLRCAEMYADAGVALLREGLVGLGTVCRRQATKGAMVIVHGIRRHLPGIRLHGFGFKIQGLTALADEFVSADSMAWSVNGRRNPPMDGCAHANCANCSRWALAWRDRLAEQVHLRGAA